MGNMLDYLDWRGDIPFSSDPFNDVDNLILATLAYSDFEGIVPAVDQPSFISVQEANERFWATHTHEQIEAETTFYKRAPYLLEKLAVSERFRELKLMNYVNRVDANVDEQMSAVTFLPGDGTIYVAFKGTDDTLTGWKEDFNFSYSNGTEGQKEAVNYLNETQRLTSAKLRVGGHSKGGNFAVYAAAFCRPEIKERISIVYSNDGPGFVDALKEDPQMQEIIPRIVKYTPEFSTIGALLASMQEPRVVKSDASGVMQHDAFSWQILGNRMVLADSTTRASAVFDQTMRTWIAGETPENRKLFIDTFFGLFDSTGVTTLSEVNANKLQTVSGVINAFNTMPKESKEAFQTILRHLGKSMNSAMRSELTEERAKIVDWFKENVPKSNQV